MTTDIETKNASEIEEHSDKAGGLSFVDYVQIVGGMKELPDSEVDANAIMAQIMGSDSLEAGLGENKAEGLRNHIGEAFRVHDFRLNRSDAQYANQGGPVYAAIDATFEATGERVVLTSGGANVLAGLGLILKLGTWDESFTTKQVETPNGKTIKLIYLPRVGEGSERF
jgi:hypothetical protein